MPLNARGLSPMGATFDGQKRTDRSLLAGSVGDFEATRPGKSTLSSLRFGMSRRWSRFRRCPLCRSGSRPTKTVLRWESTEIHGFRAWNSGKSSSPCRMMSWSVTHRIVTQDRLCRPRTWYATASSPGMSSSFKQIPPCRAFRETRIGARLPAPIFTHSPPSAFSAL